MPGIDTDPDDLARQAWIMYSIGIAMIVARTASQVNRVGWKRIALDDYMMVFSGVSIPFRLHGIPANKIFVQLLYTALVITILRSVQGNGANGFTEAEVASMTPSEIAAHSENAKFVNISEQIMLCTIYSLKACMLMIYSRLT